MVLVLLFCTVLIIVISLFFVIIFFFFFIEVKNFKISNLEKSKENAFIYEVTISLEILNKLKYFSLNLNAKKIRKITLKMHLDKTKLKELEREISLSDIKEIANIKPKISYMNLQLKLGIEDILATTYAVPIISTLISILLPLLVVKENLKNIKYEIKPMYNMGNMYDINLDIGIKVKILKVLNTAYRIYKSRKKMYKLSKIGTYYQ